MIAVELEVFGQINPPTPLQVQQSLEATYGKPTDYNVGRRIPTWEETGKPQCARDGAGEPMPYNTQRPLEQGAARNRKRRTDERCIASSSIGVIAKDKLDQGLR